MPIQQYSVNQYPVETLITWIKSDEIAIPEIQRPFVWNAAKVRDFIDSLYKGYPVGYLMVPFAFRVWCAYGQKGQTLKANGTGMAHLDARYKTLRGVVSQGPRHRVD